VTAPVEFRVLGPLEALVAGAAVDLGPARQRALLAALLVSANQVVSVDRLLDDLWGETPPATAPHALQVYVSNLRKLLDPGRLSGAPNSVLVTRRPGYLLEVGPEQLDAIRFEAGLAEGRRALAADDPAGAAVALRAALGFWRGAAYADLADERACQTEAARLEELHLAASEDRLAADLLLGRHAEVVAELETLVARNPLRERLWEQLARSLYRCGRQAEALRTIERVRRTLAEELGLQPGPGLRQLEDAILRHDPGLQWRPQPGERDSLMVDDAQAITAAGPDHTAAFASRPQRRRMTVLAVELAEPADFGSVVPAADRRVIDETVTAIVADAVEAFGGTLVDAGSRSRRGVFGMGGAQEDDAERAVRAALRVVDDLSRFGTDVARAWDVDPFGARAGVNTGWTLLGPGEESNPAVEALASAALEAASAASPGGVAVTTAIRQLVDPVFVWAGQGTSPAHDVVSARASVPFRGFGLGETPIAGRRRELSAADAAVTAVLAGTGGVLVVSGEAGIGKSRLLAEMRRRFEAGPSSGGRPLWLEGRCASFGEAVPYWPFRQLLREWLGTSPNQPQLRTRVALRREVDALFGEETARVYPLLATVLGLPLERDAAAALAGRPPDAVRADVFGAVRSLIERLAADRPVAVALDDLHWADPTSLLLVDHLLDASDASAVLVVLAERPEHLAPSRQLTEAAVRRIRHRTRQIALEPLTDDDAADLLRSLLGLPTLPPPLLEVVRVGEGNPFFIEELVRSLADAGSLTRTDDGWRCDDAAIPGMPQTVEGLLLSRIDRLTPVARDVLGAGSVLGRQFALDLVTLVCDPGTDVGGGLRELQRAELVQEVRRWPRLELRFRHALVQEVAYSALDGDWRRTLHHRAARAIETLVPDRVAESYAVLAHHCWEAGELDRSAAYHQLAGDEARAVNAVDEALAQYGAGLAAIEAGAGVDPAIKARLHLGRGRLWFQRGNDEAGPELERALGTARAAEDRALELEALEGLGMCDAFRHGGRARAFRRFAEGLQLARAGGDHRWVVAFANRLAIEYVHRLELDRALASAEEASAAAVLVGTDGARARGLDGWKLVALALGDLASFRTCATELRRILSASGELWYLKFALSESACEAAARGRFEDAFRLLDQALAVNERLGDRVDTPYFLTVRAWLERSRGEYGQALRSGRDAVSTASQHPLWPWWRPWAEVNLGSIYVELGLTANGIHHLEMGRELARADGERIQVLRGTSHLAWASWVAGKRGRSVQLLAEAEDLLAKVTVPPDRAWLGGADAYVSVARTLEALGRVERGRDLLAPLLVPARASGWHEVLSMVLLGLGSSTEGDAAEPLVQEALAAARAGGLRPLQRDAHAILAQQARRRGDGVEAERQEAAAADLTCQLAGSLDDADLHVSTMAPG
jgi:DNA-binding SARP family transcriptional activator